jgi:hypothetical protein
MGNPIKQITTTVVTVQSGMRNTGKNVVAPWATAKATAPYESSARITLRRFSSSKKLTARSGPDWGGNPKIRAAGPAAMHLKGACGLPYAMILRPANPD